MMKINYISFILFFLSFFASSPSYSQLQIGPDSVFYIRSSPFFTDLLSKPTRSLSIEVGSFNQISSFDPAIFKMNSGEFIKIDRSLFFHLHNTGKIYKYRPESSKPDSLKFERLDATVNANYNTGSYIFPVGGNIYEFGGYGFWKSNGILRKYNFRDREWDVVVLNREVFMPASVTSGHCIWVDSSQKFLYVPYQRIINDGVAREKDELSNLSTSYRLNLKTFNWEYLGRTNQDALNILQSPAKVFSIDKGLFAVYMSRIYWVDFESNSIKVLVDPSLTQTLYRIQPYMLLYWDRQHLFRINSSTGRYDSIYIDTTRFSTHTYEIWRKEAAFSDYIWMLPLLAVLFVVAYIQYKKKRKLLLNSSMPDTEDSKHPFVATEISLLELLMAKQLQGLTVTIPEINYVLGLKDKNQGMQKKVRSDIINRINEKYSFLSQEKVSLVQNIRSETDKRFFEYHLNPEHLERLRALLS